MAKSALRSRDGIQGVLLDSDVLSSSEIIARLRVRGVSPAAARQAIRRYAAENGLWRSRAFVLAGNQRLFAKRRFVTQPEFLIAAAEAAHRNGRSGTARCLRELERRGTLHQADVARLLAVSMASGIDTPVRRLYAREVRGLQELGARTIQRGTPLESLSGPQTSNSGADSRALACLQRLRIDAVVAQVLTDRLRRQNLLAWNSVALPTLETPWVEFNRQVFTAYGFSYLSPLVGWRNRSPIACPVLADCYHEPCSLAQVESFDARVLRATHRGRSKMRALGIIAAKDFDRDAWNFAKASGLMPISLRQMVGDEALEAMRTDRSRLTAAE